WTPWRLYLLQTVQLFVPPPALTPLFTLRPAGVASGEVLGGGVWTTCSRFMGRSFPEAFYLLQTVQPSEPPPALTPLFPLRPLDRPGSTWPALILVLVCMISCAPSSSEPVIPDVGMTSRLTPLTGGAGQVCRKISLPGLSWMDPRCPSRPSGQG